MEQNYSTILSTKILFFSLIIVISFSCKYTVPRTNEFFCSAENYNDSVIVSKNKRTIHFQGFSQICDTVAYSGNNSLFMDKDNPFAFSTRIKFNSEGTYNLTFWVKGYSDSVLAVMQGDTFFYKNSYTVVDSSDLGWKKISLIFIVNKTILNKIVKLYAWYVGKSMVFVDDFELKAIENSERLLSDTIFWMYIEDSQLKKIEIKRQIAFKKGVLSSNDDDWIKAMIIWGSSIYKVNMRLKGDWLDHIKGDKWSFRIKIKKGKAFKGMKIFSVQSPETRHYVDQWFLSTLFRSEDLLATRYGFISGQRNNKFLGIYAYEEHFRKQLVESLGRREGPILKHSEEPFWDLIIDNQKTDRWLNYPMFEASKILPFAQNYTLENEILKNEFSIAKNLLFQHKWGLAKVSDLFDVDKAAKYFALLNVMQGYHNLRWHNQRYYYNPVTSKLEFIAYDNYVGGGVFKINEESIIGNVVTSDIVKKPENGLNYYLFTDSLFVEKYIKYLRKYSSKNYWDSVFIEHEEKLLYYESLINIEYSDYSFDKNLYYSHAKSIKKMLNSFETKMKNGLYNEFVFPRRKQNFYLDSAKFEYLENYMKAFVCSKSDKNTNCRIINFFPTQINLTAYISDGIKYSLKNTVVGTYHSGENEIEISIKNPKVDYLVVSDGKSETNIEVLPWSKPKAWSPRQELELNNKFPNETFYKLVGNNVIFNGKQSIDKIILIPKNYKVVFEAGTEIDFVKGGAFLSYSDVFINGTKLKPVKLFSSDKTARGFTVLQAKNVKMNYAFFNGLNTFNYKGWVLTGAVTIYESNIKISNSKFVDNQCEDNLNFIRSNFEVSNSLLKNTFSDAFDSDFSTGTVKNCTFINLGNDAIDFSTSKVLIQDCNIANAHDKAISGGEASHLVIKNCNIDGSVIAVASKDNSVLKLSDIQINNSTYGLVAFQKKAEYGSGKIIADKIKAANIVQFSLIEKGSLLILDGLSIEGKYKNVAKKFY